MPRQHWEAYRQVSIGASDGNRYTADLSSFASVHCFPRDATEWSKVSIDGYGLALVWACHFEVHIDQIIGSANRVEKSAGPVAAQSPHESPV